MAIRAGNIANVNTPGYQARDVLVSEGRVTARNTADPVSGSTVAGAEAPNNVDLAKDLVGMRTDQLSAGYDLKAIKAQDRLTGTLLDLVG